jgi:hypothetical protein
MTVRRPIAPNLANEGAQAMTQTCCETSILPTPARRRTPAAPPVLIQVPNLGPSPRAFRRPVRRRRLRKEVRIVGIALLALFPIAFTLFTFGGDKLPSRRASRLTVEHPEAQAEPEPATRQPGVISLAPLEPVVTIRRELDPPVILPGYLLPADASEEPSDGGH